MTVNAINGSLLSGLSAIDGIALSTISAINGQAKTSSPFGADPSTLSGLELWYDAYQQTGYANDARMIGANAVTDFSGNARHGSGLSITPSFEPKYKTTSGPNSRPCFDLTETGYFDLPNFLTGFTSGEGIAIVKITTDPPGSTAECGSPFGFWTGDATLDSLYPFTDSKIYEGSGSTARKTGTNPTLALTSWRQYNFRTASGSYIARLDDSEDVINTGTNTVGWGTTPRIGRSRGGVSITIRGQIAEIIFYSRVLNNGTERRPVINAYLNSKFATAYPTS